MKMGITSVLILSRVRAGKSCPSSPPIRSGPDCSGEMATVIRAPLHSPAVLRLVMSMVEQGNALCLPGNHDVKLLSKLRGRDVRITHGLAETLKQLESESEEFKQKIVDKRFTGPVARIVKPARVT